ncbi:MAG: leucine-rich repeat protein [Eubacterium sp.]
MKRSYKKILAMLLALALTFTSFNGLVDVLAATYRDTTTADDYSDNVDVNAEVYFVSKATGKIITLNGKTDDPISCSETYNESKVPANAKFTIYYGTGDQDASRGLTVVNFKCAGTTTSWGAGRNNTTYQAGSDKCQNPSGWEAVMMEPQGDGTISFKSCNAARTYFTVAGSGNSVTLTTLEEGDDPTDNEKFIMYTKQTPKAAKKVKLDNVSGDSVDVSWEGVDRTLFSGYEVLYSKTENGTYTSAGFTKDTSKKVSDLELNTKYFFKVRTHTNNKDGAYSDSKIAYVQTLSTKNPAQPLNVKAELKDGKMVITWDKANSADKYIVYRAVSRYAEYKEIGTTSDLTFTDTNLNKGKYNNYYKIQGVNGDNKGKLSEPASLEISMFGSDVYIINETDDLNQVYETENQIFQKQWHDQFGNGRYTFAFKSGDYSAMEQDAFNVGYYMQVIGLGKTPYDVRLKNIKAPAALSGGNVTCNFWVNLENVTIADTGETDFWEDSFKWSVSQAAPARRLNVERTALFQWHWEDTAWASGGYIADSRFEKKAGSYSQQQYYYRNCEFVGENSGVYGVNWNQVIQGCTGITSTNSGDNTGKNFVGSTSLINKNGTTNWDQRGCSTVIDDTPWIREKPFLFFDESSEAYKVFVPDARKNSEGISWSETSMGDGQILDVEKSFYIASPDDSADEINKQLAWGKNIIFQPGIYHVDKPIQVNEPNTILLGLGMATIIPDNKEAAIKTADVAGLAICGLILDAGNYSDTLLTVGTEGCNRDHSDNPTVLQDVIYRVGGTGDLGRCGSCQVINSNDVIVDHTWIWRADHGDNTGWYENTAKNGIVVNGDNVVAYGLFCEHFQEYDILWRGENGATYFLQNEKCYDPQSQAGWMSHGGTKNGYAAYKVANNVKNHYAVGLGIYDVFINTNGASIYLDNAIEVPDTKNVLIENACIVEIAAGDGPQVGINNIVNNTVAGIRTGAGNNGGYAIQRLLSYSAGSSLSLPDYYTQENSVEVQVQVGQTPTRDTDAEKDIKKDPLTQDPAYAYPTPPLWEMTDADYQKKQEECYKAWLLAQKNQDSNNTTNTNDPGTKKPGQDSTQYGLKVGQTFDVGNYRYKITSITAKTGNVSLIKVIKKKNTMKKATVPATVSKNGYTFKVTAIGTKAFSKAKKLKKITFGTNVKTIGKSAFTGCKKLKTIKFKKVQTVGKKAFYNCKKLKKVTFGTKVKTIKASAFAKCKNITTITFGKNVKKIQSKAFANSAKLKKITFKGTKVKKVAKNAFNKKVRKTVTVSGKSKAKKVALKSLKRKK